MNAEFQDLSLVELIELLEEVPSPPPIPLTPQTSGWIVVGVALAVVVFLAVRWLWMHWRANAYRRAALRALDKVEDDPVAIASILRRAALVAYPRSEIAPLSGDGWLAFLDSTYPGSGFENGPGRAVASAPYRPHTKSPELHRIAKDWLRKHKTRA